MVKLSSALLSFLPGITLSLQVPLRATSPIQSLQGVYLQRVATEDRQPIRDDNDAIDLGTMLGDPGAPRTLLVFGTYPADFNMIEYAQKVRYYLPALRERKGIHRTLVVINGGDASCLKLANLVDLPSSVELLSDPTGEAGRAFGVSRGWRPDDQSLNPFVKLYLMLFGVGPPQTLPAVIAGYIGNPWGHHRWIESALWQGQTAGRWPDNVLSLHDEELVNNFDNLPIVGSWGRRPLELATLRLQNLVMSFQNWDALKPVDDRCLTQLGGCTVVDPSGGTLYSWLDDGICDVLDFEDLLTTLPDVNLQP